MPTFEGGIYCFAAVCECLSLCWSVDLSVGCTQVIKISILDILGVCYCNLFDIMYEVLKFMHMKKGHYLFLQLQHN